MATKERMKEFLKSIGKSEGKFELEVGLSNGFVSKIGDSVRQSSINKISKKYPDLNINWLQTGEGFMSKKEKSGTIAPDFRNLAEMQKQALELSSNLQKFAKEVSALLDLETSGTLEGTVPIQGKTEIAGKQ